MKQLIYVALLLLLFSSAQSQDERQKKLDIIRTELNTHLQKQLVLPTSPDTEKKIQQIMASNEVKDTAATGKERYTQLKAFFIENQFWNENPAYKNFATKRNIGSIQNLCANGGFENGNNMFTHSGSFFIGDGSNNCSYAASVPFNPTLPSSPVNSVPNRMEIVNNSIDPNSLVLQTTHRGSKALRINSYRNSRGGSCDTGYNAEIDMASVSFKVDVPTGKLTFWYAVILESPDHNNGNGENPFFAARLRDEVTGAVQTICLDPSQINMMSYTDYCASNILGAMQTWRCASFDLSKSFNHDVTLEFMAADCAKRGHYGYAYIDDICLDCNDLASGNVTINSSDVCFTDNYQFNGTYRMPAVPGSTLQSLVVALYQNGAPIYPPVPITIANGTFTGNVPFNRLTPGQSYDLMAVAFFSTPNGPELYYAELVPGIQNDFTVNAAACCVPPRTGSPAFNILSGTFNNLRQAVATATDLQPANHWWALMETSQQGNTSDAATIGQVGPLQSGMGLTNATFNVPDNCKAYYIKHGIWLDGCFTWQEQRLPLQEIPGITNRFNFEDQHNEPRNGFCYGEEIYLDARNATGANAYLVNIMRRPAGTSAAYTQFGSTGWLNSGLNNRINLSQLFASQNPPLFFEPGYTYQLSLTLSSALNCSGNVIRTDTFRVSCCTGTADARFLLTATTGATLNYNINATQLNGFTGAYSGARHIWIISSGLNAQQSGPFTTIAQTSQPGFTFANAQSGVYYYVLHRVYTACGNYCAVQMIYRNARTGKTTVTDLDCTRMNEIWGICDAPVNPRSNCRNNSITWDAVSGTPAYEIEITTNDPACCQRPAAAPSSMRYRSNTNSFAISGNLLNACFSWRVRTVCGNGNSKWSNTVCYSCTTSPNTPVEIIKPVKGGN